MTANVVTATPSSFHHRLSPSPLSLNAWRNLSLLAVQKGFLPAPSRENLLHQLIHGFRIGVDPSLPTPSYVRRSPNLGGTESHHSDYDPIKRLKILQSLQREIQLGRTAGPFASPPFPNLQISPIGAVPKKRSEKLRVIHHLSYPRDGGTSSVNSRLIEMPCHYLRFDAVLRTIADIGPSCLLAKIDVKDAFRLLRVHPDDQYNLGMHYEGYFFYERCISFGIHPGPALYEFFATAVEAICKAKGIPHIPHYADDSLLISTATDAATHYALALSVFRQLGIPLSEDKLIPPSPSVEFLGIIIDCPSGQLRIPEDKLQAYRKDISHVLSAWRQGDLKVSDLHSLMGILIYSSRCVQHGHLFLFYLQSDLTKALNPHSDRNVSPSADSDSILHTAPGQGPSPLEGITMRSMPHAPSDVSSTVGRPLPPLQTAPGQGPIRSPHRVMLSTGSLMELQWWDKCLREWNGVNIIPPSLTFVPLSQRFSLYTDACNTGMGAWLLSPDGHAHYLLHRWTDDEISLSTRVKRISMPFLEMFAVIIAVFTWRKLMANSAIILKTDCSPVVTAIKTGHSKVLQSHQLLLSLFLITTINHIFIDCSHIDGVDNVESDALSRAAHNDTHRQNELLNSTFFSFSSVLSIQQLHYTPIDPLPSDLLGPVWKAFATPPWRIPPTRHTTSQSNDSSHSVTPMRRHPIASPTKIQSPSG